MCNSQATTRGVSVEVESSYVPERSRPLQNRWFFAYRIRISNTGDDVEAAAPFRSGDDKVLKQAVRLDVIGQLLVGGLIDGLAHIARAQIELAKRYGLHGMSPSDRPSQ